MEIKNKMENVILKGQITQILHTIKIFECDLRESLKISILMNLFQGAAEENIDKLGIGYDYLKENSLGWVALNYHINILKMHLRDDTLIIKIWPNDKHSIYEIRDFLFTNDKNEILVQATSRWTLINLEKRQPVAFSKYLPEFTSVDKSAFNSDFEKITPPTKIDLEKNYTVNFDDLDVNNHVNNAIYSIWSSNAVPSEFHKYNEIQQLEINFKQEAILDDNITIYTQLENNTSIHEIKRPEDDTTLATFRIKWKQ